MNHRIILPMMILVILIISPVTASLEVTGGNIDIEKTIHPEDVSDFTYTADADERIAIMEFDLPLNTVVNFTLEYGTGSTVDGWMIYQPYWLAGKSYSEVSIGSDVYSETFIDAQAAGYSLIKHVQFASYARNSSSEPIEAGFALYAQGYGVFSKEIAFYPVSDLPQNLIYKITFHSNQPISFTLITNKADRLAEFVTTTVSEASTNKILQAAEKFMAWLASVGGAIAGFFYWFKLIFIDHIRSTMVVFFLGALAYAMLTSKNPFQALKKFFGLMRSLLTFIWDVLDRIWHIITRT